MPIETLTQWLQKGVAIQQVYAMTETGVHVMAQTREEAPHSLGTAGRPALGVSLSLRDQAGEPVPDGAVGELCVRSPCVTPGYWANRLATTEAFDGGWLRTGDSLRRRPNGHYEVVGRVKDMFISGGENVYPAEVENALFELEGVLEAAVVSVPHDRWGKLAKRSKWKRPGQATGRGSIKKFLAYRLAKHKGPQRVHVVDSLPPNWHRQGR